MSFLIVDLKRGGIDGFYHYREDAERIARNWMRELCHSQVVVAETVNGPGIEIDSYCFLPDRKSVGALHGPEVQLDAAPPDAAWKQCAITQCTEILRDLYSPDYTQCDIVTRLKKLLALVDGRK
jgi:hypothetical protein